MADSKTDAKKADSTTNPKPVGTAARFDSDSTSLPLSGAAPLASESSDPAVHQLLAEKEALRLNRETIAPPVDKDALKGVDERIAEVDKQLAELGFPQ